jgi:hypothetical protein
VAAEFFAVARDQLKAEADAEDRLALVFHHSGERLDQAAFVQVAHAVAECADARQDQLVGFGQLRGVRGHDGFAAEAAHRRFHRGQIAEAVINDADHVRPPPSD